MKTNERELARELREREGLSMKDKIPPRQTVERMIAVRFELSQADLKKLIESQKP